MIKAIGFRLGANYVILTEARLILSATKNVAKKFDM